MERFRLMLNIIRAQGHHYSGPAVDLAVVIDVIRAFTTEKILFQRGATSITLIETVEQLFTIAESYPEYITIAEEHGLPVEGATLCNSPSRALLCNVSGRKLFHASSNGSKATHAVKHSATEILVTGLSNAIATASYIKQRIDQGTVKSVLLLASHPIHDDDVACGDYIEAKLNGVDIDTDTIISRVINSQASRKFKDPKLADYPIEDVAHYCKLDDGDFVMQVNLEKGLPVVTSMPI